MGISFGHLFGRHGFVFGVNIIDPPDGSEDDKLIQPYIAGLFKF